LVIILHGPRLGTFESEVNTLRIWRAEAERHGFVGANLGRHKRRRRLLRFGSLRFLLRRKEQRRQ
jgi:hypothetical protein